MSHRWRKRHYRRDGWAPKCWVKRADGSDCGQPAIFYDRSRADFVCKAHLTLCARNLKELIGYRRPELVGKGE